MPVERNLVAGILYAHSNERQRICHNFNSLSELTCFPPTSFFVVVQNVNDYDPEEDDDESVECEA